MESSKDNEMVGDCNVLSEPAFAYTYANNANAIAMNIDTCIDDCPCVVCLPTDTKVISYSFLQAEKKRQKQMIATGKMEKPELKNDVFTLEQETDFSRKITIDDIFQNV
ncbi:MAG: hypothetical protein FWD02_06035 [Bacteroidales bacterium]|nr:hypothetical protein [Bacteroidales bacterium]